MKVSGKNVFLLTLLLTAIVALILGLTVELKYISLSLIICIPGISWATWLWFNTPTQEQPSSIAQQNILKRLKDKFPTIPLGKLKEIYDRALQKVQRGQTQTQVQLQGQSTDLV